jgi:hypothetical protein
MQVCGVVHGSGAAELFLLQLSRHLQKTQANEGPIQVVSGRRQGGIPISTLRLPLQVAQLSRPALSSFSSFQKSHWNLFSAKGIACYHEREFLGGWRTIVLDPTNAPSSPLNASIIEEALCFAQ